MKNKIIFSIFIVFLVFALIGCSGIITPDILSANFIITEWKQTYYEYIEEWSDYVYVYYEIENTGNVEIDYYKVYFTVNCMGGSQYYDWTNGLSVGVGKKYSDWTMVNVAGKKAISVEITDWELENWWF